MAGALHAPAVRPAAGKERPCGRGSQAFHSVRLPSLPHVPWPEPTREWEEPSARSAGGEARAS